MRSVAVPLLATVLAAGCAPGALPGPAPSGGPARAVEHEPLSEHPRK